MRTDIHCPSKINPEEYNALGVYCAPSHGDPHAEMWVAQQRKRIQELMDQHGWKFTTHEHGGSCRCCGAHAATLVAFVHVPSKEILLVGETCAYKVDQGVAEMFRTARKVSADARLRKAGKAKAELILDEAGLSEAWDLYTMDMESDEASAYRLDNGDTVRPLFIIRDIVNKLVKYGSLSEKQLDFLRKLVNDAKNEKQRIHDMWEQRRLEKENAEDCPTGRIVVTGKVITLREQDGQFGTVWKMLVVDDRGYKVWCSVPSGLDLNRFDRVQLTVTLTPSKDDPKFGFGSRPAKSAVLERYQKENAA